MSINVELFEKISKSMTTDLSRSQDNPKSSDLPTRSNFVDPSVKEFHDKVEAMAMKFGQSVLVIR